MAKNKRLTVLSETERFALYGLPDFDTNQQMQYLIFTDDELSLIFSRKNISAQVYCALQIGYFKAKHTFFRFSWEDIEEDLAFVVSRYFNDQPFVSTDITKYEYYEQRSAIAALFGYRLWTAKYFPQLEQETAQIVYKDVTPSFIVTELITYLKEQRMCPSGEPACPA
jgi:hypothetical protein